MASPTNPKPPPERTPSDGAEKRSRPRFDERIEGDPFEVLSKYEEVTLPPHQRLKWMSAKLPSASPELLQDTVPPNGGVKAPAKPQLDAKSEPAPPVEVARKPSQAASAIDASQEQKTVFVPRVRRKRQLRGLVALAVGAAALLALVAVILSWSGRSTSDPPRATIAQPLPAIEAGGPKATPAPLLAPQDTAPAASSAPPRPSLDVRGSQPGATPIVRRRVRPDRGTTPIASAPAASRPPSSNDFDTSKPWED